MEHSHLASSCNRARGATASILGELALMMFSLRCGGLDARANIGPCSIIQRLLLQGGYELDAQ
jgi:hypothetical protein